jgi:hypothetical protein
MIENTSFPSSEESILTGNAHETAAPVVDEQATAAPVVDEQATAAPVVDEQQASEEAQRQEILNSQAFGDRVFEIQKGQLGRYINEIKNDSERLNDPKSQGYYQTHALNRIVEDFENYPKYPSPDIANKLKEYFNIPSFTDVKTAEQTLGSEKPYMIVAPTEHMQGRFMVTPWKAPSVAEATGNMLEQVGKVGKEAVYELGREMDMITEGLSVGAISGIEGWWQLSLLLGEHAPDLDVLGRMSGDAVWFGQPFKGMETWRHERNDPKRQQYYAERRAEVQKIFHPLISALEENLGGTEHADWKRSRLGYATKLFGEIMGGGGLLLKPAAKGIKFAVNPKHTVTTFVASYNAFKSLALSSSFSKASMQAVKNTIPKSRWLMYEADAALAAVGVLEGTKKLLGYQNPYADLIALPLMLFAGVVQPGHRLARGSKKAFLNHKVSFLSWWYGGYKGWRNPDTGSKGLPSPTDTVNLDKVRQVRINFLRSKGRLTDDEIDRLVYEPDEQGLIVRNEDGTVRNIMRHDADEMLLKNIGFEKISRQEEKKLKRMTAALEELKVNNRPEYDALIARMDHNFDVYTQLQRLANDSLPPESREYVNIYLNQLTELAQFNALYAQFAATTNEGARFLRMHRIRLHSTMHNVWKDQVRLRKANLDVLKKIKDEFKKSGSEDVAAKKFIEYATEASHSIEAGIVEHTRTLETLLSQGKQAAKSRTVKATHDIQERVLPGAEYVDHGAYSDGQRRLIDAISETDVKINNDKYDALGDTWNELDVDVTELRNTFAQQLNILKSDNTISSDLIDVISDLAKTHMPSGQAKRLTQHLTEPALQQMDKDDLIDTLNTIDDELGRASRNDIYQDLEPSKLISRILKEKETAYAIVPAQIKMGSLITLMRTLSKNAIQNAHTQKGHAYSVLWRKTMEYLDPTVTKKEIITVDGKKVKVDVSAFKDNVTGLSKKDYKRAAYAFQTVQSFFKNEMVPRYRIGLGSLFQSQKAGFSDEALFQQFFSNPNDMVNSAKLVRLYLTKIGQGDNKWALREDGTSPTYELRDDETVKEFIKNLKYGFWRQLTDGNLKPVQLKSIISEFGGKANSKFDIDKIDILEMMDPNLNAMLRNLDESISPGWQLEYDKIILSFDELLKDVKDVKNLRLQTLKKSAGDVIKESSNPYDFFFTPNIILKKDALTKTQMVYFDRLIKEQGAAKLSKEGEDALTALKGRVLEDHDVGITAFEYYEMATDGFKGSRGRLIKETLREIYAKHISNSSINYTGHKYPWVSKVMLRDGKTQTLDFPEEHIDSAALTKVLEETEDIRSRLFDPETNRAWAEVLRRETTLLKTGVPTEDISGLPSPHRISSWMARGFSIARGVLSLRYFVGETAINHYRLGYMKMMKELLTDPDGPFNLMQMLGMRKGHTKMNYAQGIKTMATFIGVNAAELQQQMPPEEWDYLLENGHLRSGFFNRIIDASQRKTNLRKLEQRIARQKRIEGATSGRSMLQRSPTKELQTLYDVEREWKIRQKQFNP